MPPDRRGKTVFQIVLRWLPLALGALILLGVIFSAKRLSEEREFVRLLREIKPGWLLVALALQSCTYVAQSAIWRSVLAKGGSEISRTRAFKLSLAKLFVDQTVPSAGISGTVVIANALEKSGVVQSVVLAAAVINVISYHSAFLLSLAVALAVAAVRGHASTLIFSLAILFVLFAAAVIWLLLVFSARVENVPAHSTAAKPSHLRKLLKILRAADIQLVHDAALLAKAVACQLAIVLCDASTIWVLILGLGSMASPSGVFASYILSTLFRNFTFVPGGLGTFEAASVVTLNLIGVSIPVALSATLLFRFLSFWLPMLPGLIFSRRI